MNKGLVLEFRNDEAVVMTPAGEFRSIKVNKGMQWEVGMEVDIPPVQDVPYRTHKKRYIPVLAIATSFLLAFISVFFLVPFGVDDTAIAYVNIDINPSIEMEINKSLEVISLLALNHAGEQLISHLDDWELKPLSEVTFMLIAQAKTNGYFDEYHDVLLTTSFIDEEKERLYTQNVETAFQLIESRVSSSEAVDGTDFQNTLKLHKVKVDHDVHNKAKQEGISAGRYSIYLGAKEHGIELDLKEMKGQTISQIARELNGIEIITRDRLQDIPVSRELDENVEEQDNEDKENADKENDQDTKNADQQENGNVDMNGSVTTEDEEDAHRDPVQGKAAENGVEASDQQIVPPGLRNADEEEDEEDKNKKKVPANDRENNDHKGNGTNNNGTSNNGTNNNGTNNNGTSNSENSNNENRNNENSGNNGNSNNENSENSGNSREGQEGVERENGNPPDDSNAGEGESKEQIKGEVEQLLDHLLPQWHNDGE